MLPSSSILAKFIKDCLARWTRIQCIVQRDQKFIRRRFFSLFFSFAVSSCFVALPFRWHQRAVNCILAALVPCALTGDLKDQSKGGLKLPLPKSFGLVRKLASAAVNLGQRQIAAAHRRYGFGYS